MASLFSDFLTVLGVRHTEEYSDRRYAEMPFQSLFGFANLLKEYGVGTAGVRVPDGSRKGALGKLPVPFMADTADGFAIVTGVSGGMVTYRTVGRVFTVPAEEMLHGWNGIALIAAADCDSVEPDYRIHRVAEAFEVVKAWTIRLLVVALVGFAMWRNGLWNHWEAWPVLLLDCAGMTFSWMLVQKSLGIHTKVADAVCSVMEEGGCDMIAESDASSFLGIFKWSEVGMAYFSVSLGALLLFPLTMPALAAINILCLPYTVWSITYQKFKAKTWCTLCVCVQVTLWLLFAFYLVGGWTRRIFPIGWDFWVLGCCYAAAMLGLNKLDTALGPLLNKS